MILRIKSAALIVALLLLLAARQTAACTWAHGYFYQVTALKGRVVGVTYHGFPRWLRQSFSKKHAKLMLYEYRGRWTGDSMAPLVKTVEADGRGMFDFGPLRTDHYTLAIDDEAFFDVEIKELPQLTESVTIDVSPVFPDCTGGHEIDIKARR